MPQVHGYASPFANYNPGFTDLGWTTYGASPSHSDYSNATGVYSADISGKSTYEHVLTADDLAIPSRAEITKVEIVYQLGQSQLGSAGSLAVVPYLRYENGPPIYQGLVAPVYLNVMQPYLASFPTDPNGFAWARGSIYRLKGRRLLFGLRTTVPDPSLASARLYWSECRFNVYFSAPAPIPVTGGATSIGSTTAVVHGTLDPRSATAEFPAAYEFQYGLTTAYGSSSPQITGITGDGAVAVQAALSGLTHYSVYHYRLVADGPEGTVYGEDKIFSTLP
jgi:hypothetical protein